MSKNPAESTNNLRAVQASLKAALQLSEGSARVQAALLSVKTDRDTFFQAGMNLLDSMPPGPEQTRIAGRLFDSPEFLLALIQPGRFRMSELVNLGRRLKKIDYLLDIRLTRLLPGRWEDPHRLNVESVIRVLDLLNEISPGPRLILTVSHLTGHHEALIAEKATLLIARRICNWGWAKRRLESGGPEVRAGVVQGLWGLDTPAARRTMRDCLQDASERVVGKAVFGLHLLHEEDILHLVEWMANDERPKFRATAAWLAGRIDRPEMEALLAQAKEDRAPAVRLAAKEAMVARRTDKAVHQATAGLAKLADAVRAEQPAAPAKPVQPAVPEEPKPKEGPRTHELRLRLDGSSTSTEWD